MGFACCPGVAQCVVYSRRPPGAPAVRLRRSGADQAMEARERKRHAQVTRRISADPAHNPNLQTQRPSAHSTETTPFAETNREPPSNLVTGCFKCRLGHGGRRGRPAGLELPACHRSTQAPLSQSPSSSPPHRLHLLFLPPPATRAVAAKNPQHLLRA